MAWAPLPVDAVVPAVVGAERGAVLVAPPGSGKTTRVPPALVEAGRVILVQPRRVAARLAARRIAAERGWRIGGEIGWRVRFDHTVGPSTRLEVVTEGVLLRRLVDDPFLDGVEAVVLDEFHERSLQSDLALALLREAGLRVVVMSATIDPEPVARFLDVPVLRASGRVFPVEVVHALGTIPELVREHRARAGHTLVFLPGVREIERAAAALSDLRPRILHGRLPAAAQDHALAPSDEPKLVLSTNVAETSVTLEGVEVVVDSGLARIASFDPAAGVQRLRTRRISQASADQRAGRAGRTGPGRCVRAWSDKERLRPFELPEVARVDLAPAVVQIRAWGGEPTAFPWFEAPPKGRLEQAVELVDWLGEPELLARFPLHPRAAASLVAAHRLGSVEALGILAGLSFGDDRARVEDQLRRLGERHLGRWRASGEVGEAMRAGFPDRVGQRRGTSRRYRLADGQGAVLDEDGPEYLVALELRGGRGAEHRVDRWVELDDLPATSGVETDWHADRVRHRVVRRYGALVLGEGPTSEPPDPARVRALVHEHCSPADLAWPTELAARVALAREHDPRLPALDRDAAFDAACWQVRSRAGLRAWRGWFEGWSRDQRARLRQLCPERILVPTGARLRLRYEAEGPVLAARVQQLFGWAEAPRVAGRRLRIELLSPANRPVQITDDLAGFWAGSYADVRRELRGRYPKHAWPTDPATATAEDRPRRRAAR